MFDVRRSVRRTVGHPSFSNVAMDRPTVHGPRRSSREAPQCYSLVNTRFLFSVAALEPSAHRRQDERGSRDTRTTPLVIAAPLASDVRRSSTMLFTCQHPLPVLSRSSGAFGTSTAGRAWVQKHTNHAPRHRRAVSISRHLCTSAQQRGRTWVEGHTSHAPPSPQCQ